MKPLAWMLATSLATGFAVAYAAGSGGVADGSVAADTAAVAACDGDGVAIGYTTSSGSVTGVTVTGIADPGCEGEAIEARVLDGTGTSIASGSSTVAADGDSSDNSATISVAPAADADLVGGTRVRIGP